MFSFRFFSAIPRLLGVCSTTTYGFTKRNAMPTLHHSRSVAWSSLGCLYWGSLPLKFGGFIPHKAPSQETTFPIFLSPSFFRLHLWCFLSPSINAGSLNSVSDAGLDEVGEMCATQGTTPWCRALEPPAKLPLSPQWDEGEEEMTVDRCKKRTILESVKCPGALETV